MNIAAVHRGGVTRRTVDLLVTALLVVGGAACSATVAGHPAAPAATKASTPGVDEQAGETFIPYDVRPLIAPRHKYLGVALQGAPLSLAPLDAYAARIGKRPNLVEYYANWGDGLDARGARNAWAAGALPLMAWEPFKPSLAQIGSGASDAYVRRFAKAVRQLNIPIAISFGHEMNGHWYPWGTRTTTAADFVRAWRRIHDLFLDTGAGNVIWVWSPNVVNPVPQTALRPLYPGDAYVDWVGLVGYYTMRGAHSFPTLWGPTMTVVRAFTRKPFVIVETAAEPARKREGVADLFSGVASTRDVLGFVWFEYRKLADWRITVDPSALAEFRRHAGSQLFGFDVANP